MEKGLRIYPYETIREYVDWLQNEDLLVISKVMKNQGGRDRRFYIISDIGLAWLFAESKDIWTQIDTIADQNKNMFTLAFSLWQEYKQYNLRDTIVEILQQINWSELILFYTQNIQVFQRSKSRSFLDMAFYGRIRIEPQLRRQWLNVLRRRPDIARWAWEIAQEDLRVISRQKILYQGFLYDIGTSLPEADSRTLGDYIKFLGGVTNAIELEARDDLIKQSIGCQSCGSPNDINEILNGNLNCKDCGKPLPIL